MKSHPTYKTICGLAFAALLLSLGFVAQAEQTAEQPTEDAAVTLELAPEAAPVTPAVQVEKVEAASLESMLSADECVECSSHSECESVCGTPPGSFSCAYDSYQICSFDPNRRFCVCF